MKGKKKPFYSQLRLLAVLAHPDDETFGTGGTLAIYAQRGVQVHLICATRGEAGAVDPEYLQGYRSVAALREAELRCAAGLLGLAGVYFLGYRDSGMPGSPDNQHPDALAAAPLDEVAAKITTYIRRLHPQVVVTFDPMGGYRHPDHIAVHQATVKAFHAAANPQVYPDGLAPHAPQKLYFNTLPRRFLKLAVRVLPVFGIDPRAYGKNKDIDLTAIAAVSFPTHAVIDYRPVVRLRDQASACHASQGGKQMIQGPFGILRRLFSARETYMRALPPPSNGTIERDLFEKVSVDTPTP